MEQHVLPEERADGGHDEEGREHKNAGDATAEELLIKEDGEQRAEADGDGEHRRDEQDGVADGEAQ